MNGTALKEHGVHAIDKDDDEEEEEELAVAVEDEGDEDEDEDEDESSSSDEEGEAGAQTEHGGEDATVTHERVSSAQRAATEVFVGGLSFEATEEDVTATFSVAGDIAEVRLMRDKDTGVGKGFAFVRYNDPESATMAIEHLDGIEVCGRPVGVVRSQANTRLFVAGLPWAWLDEQLETALSDAKVRGVEEISVAMDAAAEDGPQSRGHAIVRFSSHSAALYALHVLNDRGLFLNGKRARRIKAEWAREAPTAEALETVTTVLVTRLPPDWDADALKAECEAYGTVVHVAHAKSMRQAQKQQDFGYVRFEDRASAERAQAGLNGKSVTHGETVFVLEAAFARPRADRDGAGQRASGRSGRGRGGRGGRGGEHGSAGRGRHSSGRGGGDGPSRPRSGRGGRGTVSIVEDSVTLGHLVDAIKAKTPAAPASEDAPPSEQPNGGAAMSSPRGQDRGFGRGKREGSGPRSHGGAGRGGRGDRGAKRPRVGGGYSGPPTLLQPPAAYAYPQQQHAHAHHMQHHAQAQYAMMMQQQAHAQAAMAQHYASMVGMPPHAHTLMMQHAAAAAIAAMHAQQQQQQQPYYGAAAGYGAAWNIQAPPPQGPGGPPT